MQKHLILLLCSTLVFTFAEKPVSWYPDNTDEISRKCYQENQLPPALMNDLENNHLIEDPKVHAVVLCQAKASGIYNEETGIDVTQLAISYYRGTKKPKCRKFLVQNCADQHQLVTSPGEKLFKVIQCLDDMEDENAKRLENLEK